MATISAAELTSQVNELYAGSDRFYAVLLSAVGQAFTANTTFAEILEYEIPSTVGAYQRQEFFYTASDINAYSSGVSVDSKRVTFTHSGTPSTSWNVTHIAVIKAPSLLSSTNVKPVLSTFDQSGSGVDIVNNRLTVSDYANFDDGYAVTVEPEAGQSLPAGISAQTIYYVKIVGGSEIELYTDEALTAIVDITGVSSGIGSIKNANGRLFATHNLASAADIGPTQSVIYDIAINQGV